MFLTFIIDPNIHFTRHFHFQIVFYNYPNIREQILAKLNNVGFVILNYFFVIFTWFPKGKKITPIIINTNTISFGSSSKTKSVLTVIFLNKYYFKEMTLRPSFSFFSSSIDNLKIVWIIFANNGKI